MSMSLLAEVVSYYIVHVQKLSILPTQKELEFTRDRGFCKTPKIGISKGLVGS